MEEAPATLFIILAIAFVAPLAAGVLARFRLPALVFEILLGIVVGPEVLDLVEVTEPIELLANLGLAALIFMAGFEVDPQRVKGAPLRLAGGSWVLSVVLGLMAAGVLFATGVIEAELYVALALTTTALGTLLPIIRDAGLLPTRFGTHVLAIGSIGEFGPIVLVALVLSGASPAKSAEALVVFAVVAVAALVLAHRVRPGRFQQSLSSSLRSSGQLYIRLAMVLIATMAFAADSLGLDFLLGAFTAGVVYRAILMTGATEEETEVIESKIEAVSFGYLVPIFFVVTGVQFDLAALTESPAAMLEVPLFLGLFLLVRGLPLVLYRNEIPSGRERTGLAFLSATALPLVVAITTIGVHAEQMKSETAAAMVGAGMVSVIVFPIIGMALGPKPPAAEPAAGEPVAGEPDADDAVP